MLRDLLHLIKSWIWQWRAARFHRRLVIATADAEIDFLRRWKEC